MKIEISRTRYQVRFYDDDHNYVGCVNLSVNGPRGTFDSLVATGFYKNFDILWDLICRECQIHIWHAHVTMSHYKVGSRIIGKKYNIILLSVEKNAGRDMCWVQITKI